MRSCTFHCAPAAIAPASFAPAPIELALWGPLLQEVLTVVFHRVSILPSAYRVIRCLLADAPREERDLLRRIRDSLDAVGDLPKVPVLSVQSALSEEEPEIDTERRISLTW